MPEVIGGHSRSSTPNGEDTTQSIDYDRLMQTNAVRVFSERDPSRRLSAIRELYTVDAVLVEPEGVFRGEAGISGAVTELLSKLPPSFAFTPVGGAIGHHGVGRLVWKAGAPNGPPAITGMDVAHFKDGRIQTLYVFLDPAAAAETQPRSGTTAMPAAQEKEVTT